MPARVRAGGARLAVAAGLSALAALAAGEAAHARPPDVAARTPIATPGVTAAATGSISAARLEGTLGGLARAAGGGSGVWVYDADSERTLFGSHASRRRILASNTKLFTTATALDRLGADARLETRVWAPGVTGDEPPSSGGGTGEEPQPFDGVVEGSLYLVGGGDPALGSRSFARANNLPLTNLKDLAVEVRRAGIEKVEGKLRVDASVFDRRRGTGVTGWSRYIGPLSGLTYNSGLGGGDPALSAGNAFEGLLRKQGIEVRGVARGSVPAELRDEPPVATAHSLELARLVDETNETSNNFFAETLLKRLDAGDGRHGTTKGGARRVRAFARRLGSKVRSRDGSGLSRANRASPHDVGKLLAGMLDHDAHEAFESSLPVAGREGTVRGRMRGTAAQGRCRAKTGTLTGVSALSGYCEAGDGPVVFSILMNRADVTAARILQDRMVAAIARYG